MVATACPECCQPIPSGAPGGQCPACLLKRGLEQAAALSPGIAETTPQGGRPRPLTAAMIAPCFPQMEILEMLGQGGMGTVFKARQTKLDRLVAVKLIRPESFEDSSFAERFMREAKTLARLSHPGIVGIHDFGEIRLPAAGTIDDSSPGSFAFYFIMEFVDGASLRQLMQSGPLSPPLALNLIGQICDALQYAHDEGVVHRDIKPENILLDTRGRVKLADFGLAKLADRSGDDWTLTGTHQVMGTPRYMAPEQLTGSRHVDHRADIYSLAVVFYEMLTGTIPVGHFAPPSKKAPVDARLDDVILKALASEPEQRFQSVRNLKSGLDSDGMAAVTSEPGAVGLSTIIDRQVANAWQFVAGRDSGTSHGNTLLPTLFHWLIAFACLLLLVAPSSVETDQTSEKFLTAAWSLLPLGLLSLVILNSLVLPRISRQSVAGYDISLLLSGVLIVALGIGLARPGSGPVRILLPGLLCSLLLFAATLIGRRTMLSRRAAERTPVRRADSLCITPEELQSGILPDVCVVCGQPAVDRESCTIEFQPKWAEAASLGGYIMGGIPGVLVQMMTSRTLQVACPTCERHRGLWHTRNLYASIGWILILLFGGAGAAISMLVYDEVDGPAIFLTLSAAVAGLLVYLVPVIWMSCQVVKVAAVPDHQGKSTLISLQRVCTPFASEVRRRQSTTSQVQRGTPVVSSSAEGPV